MSQTKIKGLTIHEKFTQFSFARIMEIADILQNNIDEYSLVDLLDKAVEYLDSSFIRRKYVNSFSVAVFDLYCRKENIAIDRVMIIKAFKDNSHPVVNKNVNRVVVKLKPMFKEIGQVDVGNFIQFIIKKISEGLDNDPSTRYRIEKSIPMPLDSYLSLINEAANIFHSLVDGTEYIKYTRPIIIARYCIHHAEVLLSRYYRSVICYTEMSYLGFIDKVNDVRLAQLLSPSGNRLAFKPPHSISKILHFVFQKKKYSPRKKNYIYSTTYQWWSWGDE